MPPSRFAALAFLIALPACAADPFADVTLPPKNYLANASFERAAEGWSFFGGSRFTTVVNDEHRAGASCLKAEGEFADHRYFEQVAVPLTTGKTYTLSAWIKAKGFARAGENTQLVNLTNYGWTQAASIGPKLPDEDWTRYTATFQAPPTTDLGRGPTYTLIIYWGIQTKGTIWIDDLQIEEGDQATDFADCFLGDAFATLNTLRSVHTQASAAHQNLLATYAQEPLGQSLATKAEAVIASAAEVGKRLAGFASLTHDAASALRADAEALRKDVAALRFVRFLGNPFIPLSDVRLPATVSAPDPAVSLTCLAGERRAIALNVANLTGHSAVARIVPGDLNDTARAMRMTGVPWLTAFTVPELRGHLNPQALFTDPLVPCDDAGQFLIGNGALSQAVLVVDTSALPPGSYTGVVAVNSLAEAGDRSSIQFTLRVLPIRLPTAAAVDICDIGQSADYAAASVAPLGINTFTICAQWLVPEGDGTRTGQAQVDFSRVTPLIRAALARCPDARFWIGFGAGGIMTDFLKSAYALTPADPLFRTFVQSWVQSVVAGFAALGVPAERLIFETLDEPGGGQEAPAAALAEMIESADPRVRTHTYVTSFNPDDEACQRLYAAHDIIGMGFTCINDKSVAYLKERGKQVWVYDCQSGTETFHPVAYNRILPWLARRYALDGWGHFSCLDTPRGRGYDAWEGVAEVSLIYPSLTGGQVISRRWLAAEAGLQDYRALLALERLAGKDHPILAKLPDQALALLKPGGQYYKALADGADASLLDDCREQVAQAAAAFLEAPTGAEPAHLSPTGLTLTLPAPARVTARYLCNHALPWRVASASLPAGQSDLPLPHANGESVTRRVVESESADGRIALTTLPPLPRIEVDSTSEPYDPTRLSDGLATPGMKFEPEHGWISGPANTDHWVVATLESPAPLSGVRLWWMTWYGRPRAYKLQLWQNDAWDDAPGFKDWRPAQAAVEDFPLAATVTDKIRIIQQASGGSTAAPTLMGLSELELY